MWKPRLTTYTESDVKKQGGDDAKKTKFTDKKVLHKKKESNAVS